ncbi:hypothetical protein [Roseovarius sp. D0-M9]|uniref:hypothetical protein n=1 Tax=Roseovarius sp. D0-M9 TaxID=3127117 RepID=UPI00300FBEE7
MNVLQRSLTLILMALLLPWGAFGASFPAVEVLSVSAENIIDRVEVSASEKRKCRTASLPGSPCGPDMNDGAVIAIFAASPVGDIFFRDGDWPRARQGPAPSTGPPRFS